MQKNRAPVPGIRGSSNLNSPRLVTPRPPHLLMQRSGQLARGPAEAEDPQIRGRPQNDPATILAFWCQPHRANGAIAGAL
jgi:hypothetical protein